MTSPEPGRDYAQAGRFEGEFIINAGVLYNLVVHGSLAWASDAQPLVIKTTATQHTLLKISRDGFTPDIEVAADVTAADASLLITAALTPANNNNKAYFSLAGQATAQAQLVVTDGAAASYGLVLTPAGAQWTTGTNHGFFGAAPAAKQTSGANLTNNVTAGGVNDTIANITTGGTVGTDIRDALYQLARKLKQINDGLRAYGLFT
jgi:hypothetical protein